MKIFTSLLCIAAVCSALPKKTKDDDHYMHPHIKSGRVGNKAPNPEELTAAYWRRNAQQTLAEHLALQPNTNQAKNVVLFMGDGMSIPTLTAARIHGVGEDGELVFDNFPYTGHSRTYCVDSMVADSACSSIAYLTGVKGNYGTLGVTAAVPRDDCAAMLDTSTHVDSIIRQAQIAGKATGIVTNTRITHASPAGSYAHTAERDWEADRDVIDMGADPILCDDVAEQLVRGVTGQNLNVIFGGGRSNFWPDNQNDEEGNAGHRVDQVNLIDEWKARKTALNQSHAYFYDSLTMSQVNFDTTDYILGLVDPGHLEYHVNNDPLTHPSLPQMVVAAIDALKKYPQGFVLFVEGGRIDTAHHDTRAAIAIDETLQLHEAITNAMGMLDPAETLFVVTSDHAHTMSINGYAPRGAGVNGISLISDVDGLPMSTLSYANGPGYKPAEGNGDRYDISNDIMTDVKYDYPALAPLTSETHGGDDVGVFAVGPWAHLFTGVFEQNVIPHMIAYAACIGDGLTACSQR